MQPTKSTILIVDDEPGQRELLSGFVTSLGCDVVVAESGEAALQLLQSQRIDMVLLDIRLPGISGREVLDRIRSDDRRLPVLLLTAYSDVRQAVAAMKSGADDYLSKPVDLEELRTAIFDAIGTPGSPQALAAPTHPPLPPGFIFESPAARRLLDQVAVIAPSTVPVLVRGETGTGKEVVARLIHAWSPRSTGPLFAMNCASLPETLIESELFGHIKGAFTGAVDTRHGVFRTADGGTLLLDEIGELPLALQPKLLRALETGQITPVGSDASIAVDTRLVVATHRNLEEDIREKRFREDLYYRVNVVELVLEPLRRRCEDILPLARHYAQQFAGGPVRLSPQTSQCLVVHPWPGNVRELRNAMQRACLLSRGDVIMPEHLPAKIAHLQAKELENDPADGRLSRVQRATILATLAECNQNRTQAAKKLGISRRSLIYKLHDMETDTD